MGTRAARAETTRGELVRVARELFAERGYDATPIEHVLREAGVSKGALYHHFANKEALFAAVYEENERLVMERIMRESGTKGDPIDLLRAGTEAWLDMVVADPAVRRLEFVDGPAVLGWHRWRQMNEKFGFGVLQFLLRHAVEIGRIRARPPDVLAHLIHAALGETALVIARADDPARAREEAGGVFDELLDCLLQRPA